MRPEETDGQRGAPSGQCAPAIVASAPAPLAPLSIRAVWSRMGWIVSPCAAPRLKLHPLLTLLMNWRGLCGFLPSGRASKDRTTVVDVHSPRRALEVSMSHRWLQQRGLGRLRPGGSERALLRFFRRVRRPCPWALLLSLLGGVGAAASVVVAPAPQLLGWSRCSLSRSAPWRIGVRAASGFAQEQVELR